MTSTTPTAAGFIVTDGNVIWGCGADEPAAWAYFEREMRAAQIEIVSEAERDAFAPEQQAVRSDFKAWPATADLLQQVETRGGAIAWGEISGVACTVEESERLWLSVES